MSLFAVVGNENGFNTKVESVMNTNLVTVDVNSPLSEVVSIFAAGTNRISRRKRAISWTDYTD